MKNHANPPQILTPMFAAIVFAIPLLASQANAQTAPTAGTVLQQVEPKIPNFKGSNNTGLTIEREGIANLPATDPFLVSSIQISGNAIIDTATLHALVADAEGQSLTLPQLDAIAARITNYYRSNGYPLARAVIPAQTIRNGVIRTMVIEPKYDKVVVDNRSEVGSSLINQTLAPIQSGQTIAQKELDHTLLLLSDIPGTTIGATLRPGVAVGTSDLVVSAEAKTGVSGNVAIDDYGSKSTGKFRLGGTVNLFNPLHLGDVLSISALTSGKGVQYGRLDYDALLNGVGTRAGGSISDLRYKLGGQFESLGAHGTALVASTWVKHPLIRSRDLNLYGQVQYDYKKLSDKIDNGIDPANDRHSNNINFTVSGDQQDAILSGGVNTWNVTWTSGKTEFESKAGESFSKIDFSVSRLQRVTANDSLYFSFNSQWANANLDASEKLVVGGTYSVRAYDTGALSGDTGFVGTAELRHNLGSVMDGQLQAVLFADAAHVTVNKDPWLAGYNSGKLGGVGFGLDWYDSDIWGVKLYAAKPVGTVPGILGTTPSFRIWGQLSARF